MTSYRCHVISNTHWDREWRYPFQGYRADLVDLMDGLLDLLERRPDYRAFFLDSQTVILEDYFEIRPENEERVRRQVEADRIQIGPWYTLPDQWGCPGEALVRNLLVGHRVGRRFGPVSKVGYTPFSNGQISQLPQLYQGFGIDSCFFYRGVGKHVAKSEFLWEGADGTRVFGFKFGDYARYNYYYLVYRPGLLGRFAKDRDYTWNPDEVPYRVANPNMSQDRQYGWLEQRLHVHEENLGRALEDARRFTINDATTRHLLYMMGHDHSFAAEEEVDLIDALRRASGPEGDDVFHSTLADYMTEFRRDAKDLQVLRGEMRHVNKEGLWTNLMGHILSCRLYLKQRNATVNADILTMAEPLAAMAWLTGSAWPGAFLDVAWKKILVNQAHDAIGGCSVDRVHEEMLARWGEVETIAEELSRRAMRDLLRTIDGSALARSDLQLTVFNTLPFERTDVAEFWIDLPERDAATPFRIEDTRGREVACQVLDSVPYAATVEGPLELTMPLKVQRVRALVDLRDLPAGGHEALAVQVNRQPAPPQASLCVGEREIANEFLHVAVNDNGTLCVTDKVAGCTFDGMALFEDTAEFGDPWNRVLPADHVPLTSARCRARVEKAVAGPLAATLRVRFDFEVPRGRDGDRRSAETVALPITMLVTLKRGLPAVELDVELDNRATDHRLRMLFPSGAVRATHAVADSQFDVVERPIQLPDATGWREAPYPTQPMWNWVSVSDGTRGLAIVNNGLIEYEAVDDSNRTLAITLLRGFGKFIYERPTPGSQCLGMRRYRLLLHPFRGTWQDSDVVRLAQRHVAPLPAMLSAPTRGTGPRRRSFFACSNDRLVLSAVKRAEEGNRLVLRLWNPRGQAEKATLSFGLPVRSAALLTLEELHDKDLTVRGATVEVELPAKRIATVAVDLDTSHREGEG
ncbi:MAG: hypothetical protein KF858_11185 [Candidatus Sumerlaeia bacterium]|nr:hypothetical protein [Candidatus Sumerlaeia bacterium]